MKTFTRYENGSFSGLQGETVKEFPLVLHVNGREIATLIASPHDLRFLVVGFLRLQGFVDKIEDFLMLALCEDYGIANVRIRNEIPEKLKPILTSGCGTGITFTMPDAKPNRAAVLPVTITPETIFSIMENLAKRADGYKSHGGIHSAAIAEGTDILLHAEDIGRHNTIDRIAGEALLKGVDLSGKILVTSGRVSTELAAKAAHLGISVIASRTSPTDQALELCEKAGITLIGYVRGGKFTVYHNAGHLDMRVSRRVAGVTAAILAGGQSSRMGSNKALLPYKGGRFIEAIYRQLSEIFTEVIVVTNTPEQYAFLPCRKVPDIYPGMGALAGVHSAVHHSSNQRTFVVACDMPYLNDDLVRTIATTPSPADGVVIPETERGLEPLHAMYGKGCLHEIEQTFARGTRRIIDFFPRVSVTKVEGMFLRAFDPELASFRNINTPEEYYLLRDGERAPVPLANRFQCVNDLPAFSDVPGTLIAES